MPTPCSSAATKLSMIRWPPILRSSVVSRSSKGSTMPMEFRFDADQEYQKKAVAAVVDLFEGQRNIPNELVISENGSFAAVANRLDLTDADLLANLHKLQERQGLGLDEDLLQIQETIAGITGERVVRFPNFSIE